MEIAIIVIFVLLNGFFSMSEISVVSSKKSRLDAMAKKGDKTARTLLDTVENPDKFLSTIQIAITTIGLIIGLYTGESYVSRLTAVFTHAGIDAAYAVIISRIIIVVVETFFMLIFGELLPKRIGMSNPEKVAGIIIRPLNVLAKLCWPFVWLLSETTGLLASLFGLKRESGSITEEEIKSIIDDSASAGEIDQKEQDMVNRVFDLDDRKIVSLMTPRNELEMFSAEDTLESVFQKLCEGGVHYIYPVEKDDRIKGVIYIKDVLAVKDKSITVQDIMREPNYLHESVSAIEMLEIFKGTKIHYALIVDEFGMVQGMITMNDILEALVGTSSEMADLEEEPEFVKRADGSYLIDGQYPFYDFIRHFHIKEEKEPEDFSTIGGLILSLTRSIPKEGQQVKWASFTFEIVDMDGVRIDKVLVTENKNKSN